MENKVNEFMEMIENNEEGLDVTVMEPDESYTEGGIGFAKVVGLAALAGVGIGVGVKFVAKPVANASKKLWNGAKSFFKKKDQEVTEEETVEEVEE